MKAKFIRGQDPKSSMDIGVNANNDIFKFATTKFEDNIEEAKYLGWNGWELDKEALDLVCDELDVSPKSVLAMDPYVVNDTQRDVLYSKSKIVKTSFGRSIRASFSDKGLIFITERHDGFILWILGVDYKLTESIRFERGLDPKDAMGIGDIGSRDIQKIDDLVSRYGFERIHPGDLEQNEEETHLEKIAEWYNPVTNVFVEWNYYPEKDSYFFYVEGLESDNQTGDGVQTIEGEGSLEDLLYPGVFENILAGEPMYWKIIKESVRFERGMAPMKTMDVGFNKALELEQDHGDFKVWNYGDLVFILDQDREPPWDWNLVVLSDDGVNETHIDTIDSYDASKEELMDRARLRIKEYLGKNESVNFKRGMDSKSAMGIGMAEDLKGYRLDNYFKSDFPYGETIHSIQRAFPGKNLKDLYIVGTSYASSIIQNRIAELESSGEIIDEWTSEGTLGNENFMVYDTDQGALLNRHDPSMPADSWFGDINMAFHLFDNLEMMGESISFERGRDPKSVMGIGGAGLIPDIPRLIFEKDNQSPYFVGGGRAIDNIRRTRETLEVKFFTNPLQRETEYGDAEEYPQKYDKMEYLKSIMEDIGILHLFGNLSYTDNMARVRGRVKEPFLLDFVKGLDEDEWYSPEQYGIE